MSTHFVATKPPEDRPAAAATTPSADSDAVVGPSTSVPNLPPSSVGSRTAVLLPPSRPRPVAASSSAVLPVPASHAARRGAIVATSSDARTADAATTDGTPTDDELHPHRPDGYVVFAVGDASFAVPVEEVRAVIRTERLDLLPGGERPRYGRGVALVDVRGRAIPVVDLRSDPSIPGEVLLPLYRHHVGLVVDRVVSVSSARELVPEPDGLPDVLPAYAQGVLRPVDGGTPVLLVGLPDAEFLQG